LNGGFALMFGGRIELFPIPSKRPSERRMVGVQRVTETDVWHPGAI
jgi:hypothetical protein